MKESIRAPAVAGMFYPADPAQLCEMIRSFLADAKAVSSTQPKALIVPHAGYIYSGSVAASGYAQVQLETIKRVVLVGPSHHVFFEGLAVPEKLTWKTPIGNVVIDVESIRNLSVMPQLVFSDKAHQDEHSLEVQLPFLQELFGNFKLVPLVVCDASPEEVAEVLEMLWGGPETLIVVSSDLSHYESYEQAVKKDRKTAESITGLDIRGLDYDNACGLGAIAGLIYQAKRRGMRAELLDLRNSGDTVGSKGQVVGYGAFAFYE